MVSIVGRLRAVVRRRAFAFSGLMLVIAAAAYWFVGVERDSDPDRNVTSLRDGERFVFVSAHNANEVAVIDGKYDRVAARIAMPAVPKQLLVSAPTGTLVASVAGASTLEIVELAPGTGRARIDLGVQADNLVLSPDGYLVAAYSRASGTLTVASLQTRRVLFRLDGFSGAAFLTFSYDGSQIYVVSDQTVELAVVDLVQQRAIERIALLDRESTSHAGGAVSASSQGVSALTRTPDGRHGFVAVRALNIVLAVDLSTLKPVKWIRVGSRPLRPYATADARVVLVPNDGDRTVSVIDTTTLQVVATLPGAADVIAINTGWFESFAFVMSGSEKRIVVLDLNKFEKVADIDLPGVSGAGIVNGVGVRLFAPLAGNDQIAVIDTRRHALHALIKGVGREPWAAAMAHSNNYCH